MKKSVPYFAALFAGLLVFVPLAFAGSIKTWSTNERLRAADINSNFQHIHNSMVGGGHATLVNADVSGSAAIAHSKLATPALIPKAWASTTTACTTGTCTLSQSSKITSVTYNSSGATRYYAVTLAYTPSANSFGVIVSCDDFAAGEYCGCSVGDRSTSAPHFKFNCWSNSGGASPAIADKNFTFTVLDTNNY